MALVVIAPLCIIYTNYKMRVKHKCGTCRHIGLPSTKPFTRIIRRLKVDFCKNVTKYILSRVIMNKTLVSIGNWIY
jgi:hypothetical protein